MLRLFESPKLTEDVSDLCVIATVLVRDAGRLNHSRLMPVIRWVGQAGACHSRTCCGPATRHSFVGLSSGGLGLRMLLQTPATAVIR